MDSRVIALFLSAIYFDVHCIVPRIKGPYVVYYTDQFVCFVIQYDVLVQVRNGGKVFSMANSCCCESFHIYYQQFRFLGYFAVPL